MRFKILVKLEDGGEHWESYDEDTDNAKQWAEDAIDRFNNMLRPYETKRTLIKVEVEGDGANAEHHKWAKRTDGMSANFRGSIVDLMFCQKCRITGKRFGFNESVKIDSKYKKKAFQKCNTSIIEQMGESR